MAVLIEHTGGKWPFWLNPRQVAVCPVADRHEEYAQQIADRLNATGLEVVVDATSKTVPKRVRAHQVREHSCLAGVGFRRLDSCHGRVCRVVPLLTGLFCSTACTDAANKLDSCGGRPRGGGRDSGGAVP